MMSNSGKNAAQLQHELPANAVAIIGMAGRFPGADNIETFWQNIRSGVESISHFTDAELEDNFPDEIRNGPNFVRARSIIEDVDKFDARFFGMLPREAALTDPQHRIFLECAWEAIEDAGYAPLKLEGPVGVFAGCSMSTYFLRHVMQDRGDVEAFTSQYQVGMYPQLVGALTDTLATRIAYKLNLSGPAVTLHTACSTSLYAIAQAWQNLLLYQCDMAIAGGVSISLPQKRGYQYLEGGMVSKDGHCRPFDAEASGTVFGSGAGAVFLKRLEDAIADDDHIYAVLRGCGVNNDGADKIGFTAPSADGQAAAIAAAYAVAEISPATVGYVECHGTATPLGDPIEFEGLCKGFGNLGPSSRCALGSAKANVGHLDAAAGVVGLIKTALMLHHGEIPPMLNFQKPNPRIELNNTPFYLPTEAKPWEKSSGPCRAGVSSFGVGGTNVHAVLEEAPRRPELCKEDPQELYVLPISAKNDAAIERQRAALATRLNSSATLELGDMAFTLQQGRCAFENRSVIVAASREEALSKLNAPAKVISASSTSPRIVFMFPGQGAQYPGMGQGLYESLAEFRAEIDQGAEILKPLIGQDIREVLFREHAPETEAPHPIKSTLLAQPALFLIEHAVARQWMRWGVQPDAMIGHSVGEFVAASLAGVIAYEDALKLIAARGRLMQDMPGGAMLAVRLPEDKLQPLLGAALDIAAINAPSLCVAAGSYDAVTELEGRLTAENIQHRRLHTSHAFHSAMMEPVTSALREVVAAISLASPKIPYISCVTGRWINEQETKNPDYWAQHCRAPVRFADGLKSICDGRENSLLIEAGPGRVLTTLAAQTLPKSNYLELISSLPECATKADDKRSMMEAAGRIWSVGISLDWKAVNQRQGQRIPLPTYPFERETHWIAPPISKAIAQSPFGDRQQLASHFENNPITHFNPSTSSKTAMSSNNNNINRIAELRAALTGILENLSGNDLSDIDPDTSFLEMGFDSLLLGQVAAQVQNKFSVKVTFRQMLNDISSLAALADHLHSELPQETTAIATAGLSQPLQMSLPSANHAPHNAVNAEGMAGIFQTQLMAMQNLIAQQNQLLLGANGAADHSSLQIIAGGAAQPDMIIASPPSQKVEADHSNTQDTPQRFRMFNPKAAKPAREITDAQRRFIQDLTNRYNAKTAKSKAYTEANRLHLADPRAASGFRPEWKELCYPIVSSRSKGSKIWDLDGNAYVDLVNGYGQTAFGHAPDFVQQAVAKQLHDGFAIGPQSDIAGEVAAKIAAFTGMERITFCNTGSEAVMAAMRIARCVTSSEKVVVFNNDYHGQFDEVLVKAGGRAGTPRALPLAPGIPFGSVENMVVLQYGAPDSLEWIRANAKDLAAVIVEPVQSRHPELRPFEFLRELREITRASETALVFDEVVTGFRVHSGGMQAVTGIRADMATYGKVLGGGMPIGVLAGTAQFMDALDGGQWRFGDDSFPETAPTFFAGTFVRHPLVLAACKAVLDHLEQEGPDLQQQLAKRANSLVERINADLRHKNVGHQAENYSSWFMVNFGTIDRLGGLLYHHMRLLGVHIQEGFPCFLTTAHSDEDLDSIANAFSESIDAMQMAGIFAGDSNDAIVTAHQIATPIEIPLTAPQTEILMAAQMGAAASCAFNESVQLRLDGDLNIMHLQCALNDVICRHEALRARVIKGETKLIIDPKIILDIPLEDLSDQTDRDAGFADIVDKDARTPFDLNKGPLIRAKLVRMATDRHELIITAHHIICDGWSMNIILNELAAIYTARTKGIEAELPPVESFSAYAKQEIENNRSDTETEKYWLDLYKTLPPVVELPSDRPRPALKSFSGGSYTAHIDAQLMNDVRKAGAKHGCTLFAALFAAFQLMIGRLSNESDVVIACPAAGQSLIEDKVLVGHCVNFLPLRAPFNPTQSCAEHMRSVKQRVLEAFDHQQYTFGTLVRSLGVPRNPNRTPLTDIQFNLEKIGEGLNFAGLQARFIPGPKAAVNFDLFFNMIESSAGLRIDVDYNTDLWDVSTIERWTENLRALLAGLVKNADERIEAMPLLGKGEREWLLARNGELSPFPQDASIPSHFAAIAGQYASKSALLAGSASLSYKLLDVRANQLANLLLSKKIGKGDRVALLATRSIDAVVVILAVLKCGAAYVPLDASYPAEQLNFMLADSKPKLVFVQNALMDRSDPLDFGDIPAFAIEQVLKIAGSASELPPASMPLADDPAYVMYTSGSTGRPKGVVATHRGVLRLVKNQNYAHFGPEEVMLHLAPLPFDASTLELWGSLLHGGQLAIVSQAKPSLAEIRNAVLQHSVTTAWFTAALFHALVDEGIETLRPLRQILAGGDVLSPAHIRKAQQFLPDCLIINGYGPTENTTFTCCYPIAAEGWGDGSVPIGKPINGTTAFIFDQNGNLSPQGAIGELYTGGEGVALGYLGCPELTAEAFVTDPITRSGRLYRTGDLVRWRNDGVLEFIGRADGQVKINGFRVEVGEIEMVLMADHDVEKAVVICREKPSGGKALFGYITRSQSCQLNDAELIERLQTHAAQHLPKHMIPAGIMVLDVMPRTSNDKIDRKSLPDFEPVRTPAPIRLADAEPMSELEQQIAKIWVDVLGLEKVGKNDPIFSLGADSLHIFRIAARLADQGLPLEARHLMRNPTIADLAVLTSVNSSGADSPAVIAAPSLSSFRRGAGNKGAA